MDGILYCNDKRCRVQLSSEAWVTSCFHIFCSEHVPSAPESERICPCCSRDLKERKDVFKRILNPPDAFKTVVLAGLSPSNIIEIGFKALEFLNFQSFHEKMFLQSYIKRQYLKLAKAEVQRTEAETSYQSTIDQLKNLIQHQNLECEKLQRNLEMHMKKNQLLQEKSQSKSRLLHKILAKQEMQGQSYHSDCEEQPRFRRGYAGAGTEAYPIFSSQQLPPTVSGLHPFAHFGRPNNQRKNDDRETLSQNF